MSGVKRIAARAAEDSDIFGVRERAASGAATAFRPLSFRAETKMVAAPRSPPQIRVSDALGATDSPAASPSKPVLVEIPLGAGPEAYPVAGKATGSPAPRRIVASVSRGMEPSPPKFEPGATTVARAPTEISVSSNRYATGSNQNVGNVLTDRGIIKVLAPPGGRTSFVLG